MVAGSAADLIEVSSSQLPGLGGKVDIVAVVHLGQVVEAAGLHTQHAVDATSKRQTDLCACSKAALGHLADIRHVIIAIAAVVDMHNIGNLPMAVATTSAFTAVLHQSHSCLKYLC